MVAMNDYKTILRNYRAKEASAIVTGALRLRDNRVQISHTLEMIEARDAERAPYVLNEIFGDIK